MLTKDIPVSYGTNSLRLTLLDRENFIRVHLSTITLLLSTIHVLMIIVEIVLKEFPFSYWIKHWRDLDVCQVALQNVRQITIKEGSQTLKNIILVFLFRPIKIEYSTYYYNKDTSHTQGQKQQKQQPLNILVDISANRLSFQYLWQSLSDF